MLLFVSFRIQWSTEGKLENKPPNRSGQSPSMATYLFLSEDIYNETSEISQQQLLVEKNKLNAWHRFSVNRSVTSIESLITNSHKCQIINPHRISYPVWIDLDFRLIDSLFKQGRNAQASMQGYKFEKDF